MITTNVFSKNLQSYLDNKRYIINQGGTRSSKSYSILQLLILIALKRKKLITIVSRTLPHLKGGIVRDIEAILISMDMIPGNLHHLSEKKFMLGESTIEYFGADDLDRVHGPSRDILFVNEATFVNEEIFNQLAVRTRENIFVDYNPSHEFWITNLIGQEKTILHTSTYLDNINNLTTEQLDEILANKKRAEEGNVYWQNWWKVYGEGIYSNIKLGSEFVNQFNVAKHVVSGLSCNYDYPIHVSFDQNVVPYYSALVHQVVKIGDIYEVKVLKEYANVNPNNNAHDIAKSVLNDFEQCPYFFVYGDATGKKRDTRGKENDYDIIKKALHRKITNSSMRVPHGNPSVNKTRDFLNRIYSESYPIRIMINNDCKHFIADMNNTKEDVDGGMLKEKYRDNMTGQSYEKYGHHLDCHRYFLTEAFKGYFKLI